jgi:hypothetical protein
MAVARFAGTMVLTLVACGTVHAQSVTLAENTRVNDCFKVGLSMRLTGEMVVVREGKPATLKLGATAEHRYGERVLALSREGLISKAARYYDDAKASITVDGSATARVLRPERRLAISQRQNDTFLCYSPQGPLTRDELESISEHFDTLCVAGLLPGKEVRVGDSWPLGNAAAQGLCQFEGLVSNELKGKLAVVADGMAAFAIDGTASGIELGAQAKVTVIATGRFDVAKRRLISLEWKQQDVRDQGPASPAATVETTISLVRTAIEQPKELSDVALVAVPQGFDVSLPLTQLIVRDLKGRFELAASRDWQPVSQTESHLVMRLLDRGDFVAQATVTPWTKAEPGKHMDSKDFHEAMLASPGWEPEEVLQEGELPNQPNGRYVYRLAVRGQIDDVKVVQTFYLVAGPNGDQCVVAVTLKQAQSGKLGARDLILVDGLEFPVK